MLGLEFSSSALSFFIAFLTVILLYSVLNKFNEGELKNILRHFFYSVMIFVLGQFFILAMIYLDYRNELIHGIRSFFIIAVAIGLIITSFKALNFSKKFGMKERRLFPDD